MRRTNYEIQIRVRTQSCQERDFVHNAGVQVLNQLSYICLIIMERSLGSSKYGFLRINMKEVPREINVLFVESILPSVIIVDQAYCGHNLESDLTRWIC